jgi:hypothetical protein
MLVVRVQDANQVAITGARVTVAESGQSYTTAQDGHVAISGFAPGTLSIPVVAPEFYPNQARITMRPGEDTVITLDLQRRTVVGESVVVTGTGTEV